LSDAFLDLEGEVLPDERGLREKLCGTDGGPLIAWYDAQGRDLPWRGIRDPYAIWVSEIMLQQTQVASVIPYYARWMESLPTVEALAAAEEEQLLSLWQGLGYYRRCRLLLQGARWIAEHGMPGNRDGWLEVPGVGPYTAGAIASIAFGEPVATVDGNVERVFARVAGSSAEKTELRDKAWKWAQRNLYEARPGDWNQALMELGATICTPRKPKCPACPIKTTCVARITWQVDQLPAKRPQAKVVSMRHVVWVPICDGLLGVRKIPPGQWWEGMWEFPRIDVTGASDPVDGLADLVGPGWAEDIGVIRHVVTNHRITIDASLVRAETMSKHLRWVSVKELGTLPMPTSQRKVLRMALELL
jgi:A/G-specific adenine glycosylase